MLTIVFMAVTSAGSAEMMAVGSLVTYDVYKVPALPFFEASQQCRGRPL
jgi:Na+/proline symporter